MNQINENTPAYFRGMARDLIAEAEYYETYEPNNKKAKRLYDKAGKMEIKAVQLEKKLASSLNA